MPIQLENTAPYAPSKVVIDILTRHRNGGVPDPVTLSVLERLGVSESLRPRTLQALKLLDFIDEQGNLTDEFANLRKVPTPEYPVKLAEMLRAAYADVFAVIEPSGATYQSVTDAFRGFKPLGQIDRMVSLFLGLLDHTKQWTDLPAARGGSLTTGRLVPVRKPPAEKAQPKGRVLPRQTSPQNEGMPPPPSNAYSQSVRLAGDAGTVTLSADVNPLALKGKARDFFYQLVDLMDSYEQETSGS